MKLAIIGCALALASNALSQDLEHNVASEEEHQMLEIASKLSRPSLAYETIARQQLLAEADYISERLKIPALSSSQVEIKIAPPWFSRRDSTNSELSRPDRIRAATFFASGVIETPNYSFSLGGPENRRYVHRTRFKSEDSILDLYPELAKSPSVIDTSGAYQLATQWLSAVSVDMAELESRHKATVSQWFFWGKPEELPKDQWTYYPPTSTNKTLLPVYDVKWGDGGAPPAQVTVLGTSREMIEMRIEGGKWLKRLPLVISNALELNKGAVPAEDRIQQPRDRSRQ